MSSSDTASAADRSSSPEELSAHWFREEIYRHDASLKSYLRDAFPSERDLDDVVQESYLRVWKTKIREPIKSAKAFLFRVANNVAIDRIRRRRVSPLTSASPVDAQPIVDERAEVAEIIGRGEKERLLADALAALPARAHQLIILCKLNGLSHQEAARRLGISERTVDEHILRGSKRLGQELRRRGLHCLYHR